jgi:serine phosphatase RsbU (regulator of sigma subunit)
MYGKDRLAQSIEKVINSSTTEIIDHIKNDLNSFSNHASQADDIALIAIKIK